MATTADYLNKLVTDRDSLIASVNAKGASLASTATLAEINQAIKSLSTGTAPQQFKLVGIGDSLMYGRLDTSTGRMSTPWINTLGSNLNADTVLNFGESGALVSTYAIKSAKALCTRVSEIPEDTSLLILNGGTNDYASDVPIGSISDTQTTTFYGALNAYYGGARQRFPKIRMIALSIFDTTAQGSAGTKQAYVDAQRAVAKKYGIEFFDVFKESMITPDTADMQDGVHMSQSDASVFAQEITDYINGVFINKRSATPEQPSLKLVWDTSTNGYDTVSTVSGYIKTATIKLQPNKTYVVTTDAPKLTSKDQASVYVTADKNNLVTTHLIPGQELELTTTASGELYLSTRPARAFDGTTASPNEDDIKSGKYKIQVYEK
ncbi:SGNH/GDSL hydrolase family protein [Ignavigranum ruoffiae]|uniref:SGNH/GDSL hydrolase family protein n=1 Tax=Ignavigranum ruoffiae TaxID=89093 RepID=UPI0023547A9A|nr:SGNH/GDSL hydrolase family protein [Ignavigranum ruoffiae]